MRPGERNSGILGLSPTEAAAHWCVRFDKDDMSEAERREFDAWIEASQHNAAAWEKAQRSWGLFDDVDEDQHIRALRQAALAVRPEKRRWPWPQLAAGIAVLAVGATLAWSLFEAQTPSIERLGIPDYVTAKGERLNLNLPDGTAVTLNTETEIDVAFDEHRRFVRLGEGQVFFDVAKDRSRPFVVEAGDRQITALGTAFDVRLLDGRFEVLLVEGTIAVEQDASGSAEAPDEPVVMTAGNELVVTADAVERLDGVDVQRKLRWRDGFIEFQNETLAEAIAEFNRYTTSVMVIDDERVAVLRVTGVFRTDRSDQFMEAVSELLPVATDNRSSGEVRFVWVGE